MTDSFALLCRTTDACRLAEALARLIVTSQLLLTDSDRFIVSIDRNTWIAAGDALRHHDEEGAR